MNFKPEEKTVRALLKSGCTFVIPRFQREYSWDKKNYQEFFEDILGNLLVNDNGVSDSQYFLGTMLFVGNLSERPDKPIEVVDGQQRLTTITILFSALSEQFRKINADTLSKQLFQYIMTKNDDGESVRILQSQSSYPYFLYYIQDIEKSIKTDASTEEEICIQETYKYFLEQTSEKRLKVFLKVKYPVEMVNKLPYIEILKAIRDQVLDCSFISIATADKDQANRIFAILNAKGKRLAYIDLIKNKIFEILRDDINNIYAEQQWKALKAILNSRNENVGLATFFRHYWTSKYKKCNVNGLYDDFNIKIPKNVDSYKSFLKDLRVNAENYKKIVCPNRDDYGNRKQYYVVVQSLNTLNKVFNIVQTRIVLLALFDVYSRKKISFDKFKETIQAMENFHCAFNAVCGLRTNSVDTIYSKFAKCIRTVKNKQEANQVVEEKFMKQIEKLYPKYEVFLTKFKELAYSKKDINSNLKTKYIINKLNCLYANKELFDDYGSIEHILPEKEDEHTWNIGNLILLEEQINNEASNKSYDEKKTVYQKSNYKWIKEFLNTHNSWEYDQIDKRAEHLAEIYYRDILKR